MDQRDLVKAAEIMSRLQAAADKRYAATPVSIRTYADGVAVLAYYGGQITTFPTLVSAWCNLVGPVESEMDIPGVRT